MNLVNILACFVLLVLGLVGFGSWVGLVLGWLGRSLGGWVGWSLG